MKHPHPPIRNGDNFCPCSCQCTHWSPIESVVFLFLTIPGHLMLDSLPLITHSPGDFLISLSGGDPEVFMTIDSSITNGQKMAGKVHL